MNWLEFWNSYPLKCAETDFKEQVGHTVAGQAIDTETFRHMIESIQSSLTLTTEDRLLDLCCGNGVVTREIADWVAEVVAVDFSAPLIASARQYNARENVHYRIADVLSVGTCALEGLFDKVLINYAVQHFDRTQFRKLLSVIDVNMKSSGVAFLGGVLDQRRKEAFLDTPEKRASYEAHVARGTDRLGTWWLPNEFIEECEGEGFVVAIDDFSCSQGSASFRFDARLAKR